MHGDVRGSTGTPAHWGARIVRQFSDHTEYEPVPFVPGEPHEADVLVEGIGDEEAIWRVVGAWSDDPLPRTWESDDSGCGCVTGSRSRGGPRRCCW